MGIDILIDMAARELGISINKLSRYFFFKMTGSGS